MTRRDVKRWALAGTGALVVGVIAVTAIAQDDGFGADPFGDNPAVFTVDEGEALWHQKRGPNNVSLEQCDLGQGPGVVKNAYARLPRYFEDVDRVMDLEARLVHCMVELQGFDRETVVEQGFSGRGEEATPLEALAAYISAQSKGAKVAVPQDHPAEVAAYEAGKALFWHRAGSHDFACATCHRQDGKRIRLQALPNLTKSEGARSAYTSWPAYRLSQGAVRTMEWRMRNCIRQQRLPMLKIGSEAAVYLLTYMGVNANGGVMETPGRKR